MIILDDVPFSKQSWQQRNRIRTRNGLEFLSVPAKTAGRLGQRILDCELADQPFVGKMINSLRANYGKVSFFKDAIDELATTMETAVGTGRLVELNCALISWMADRLGVKTPKVMRSGRRPVRAVGEHFQSNS